MDLLGVGSGMDFTSIVDQLIEIERIPITRFESKKNDYTSSQSIWREVNTRLSALSNSLNKLKLQSDFDKNTVTSEDDTVVAATTNGDAIYGDYQIEVIQLFRAQKVISNKVDNQELLSLLTDEITVTINGQNVVLAVTEEPKTLLDVAKAINETEDIGVVASVVDSRLVLEAKEGKKEISLFDDGAENTFLKAIGVLQLDDSTGEYTVNILQDHQGSIVKINGIQVERDSNVIDDAVSGLKLTLKKESPDTINLNVAKDVDQIVSTIKAFIDEYKKVQSYLDSQTSFTPGEDGKNNTTGKLFGDSTVSSLKSKLRSVFTGVVAGLPDNSIKMLAQLGVEIDRTGALTLDETKLRDAVLQKPEEVKAFFTKPDTGLVAKLQTYIKGYTENSGIIDNKVNYFSERIKDADKRIEQLEARVEMRKASLVRQYTVLDKALASLYSQSDWLAAQVAPMFNTK